MSKCGGITASRAPEPVVPFAGINWQSFVYGSKVRITGYQQNYR